MLLKDLASCLGNVKGKVIVFLGSCGSGAAVLNNDADGQAMAAQFNRCAVNAFAAADTRLVANTGEFRSNKFCVLTAANYKQNSIGADNPEDGSPFPRYIALGVNGSMPADTGGDGMVNLQELYTYVYSRVLSEAQSYGSEQHVQVYPENEAYALFRRQ